LFSKVSVFKELLAKKLKPKELLIGRATGAEVRRGDTILPLAGLSSGEKHEFIMLFRLIFETPKGSLVLIDEPEISLHVVWQLEFMADLLRIQEANNFQSIIATHSPQVIQNSQDITTDLADQSK
jgi:predicted ATP-binding protein involved in virulence